jgi:RNA polymerase sigma factor (TIGR02999 family)
VTTAATSETTQLLIRARAGDPGARESLWPHVYDTLREIARQRLQQYRPGDTLDTTALVHEAYLRLVDGAQVEWQDRAHFFALASRAMRFILVDHARNRSAAKRGGSHGDLRLETVQLVEDAEIAQRAADLITLNDALDCLGEMDGRLGQLVEYRFFGGLSYEEIASVTGRSVPTVKRDWRRARTWLYRSIVDAGTAGAPS